MPIVTGSSIYSHIRYRHTLLPALAGGHHYYYGGAQGALELSHSTLKCGQIWYGQSSSNVRQIGLTNNLFFRTTLTLGANNEELTLYAYNNLFVAGSLSLNADSDNSWLIKDCVFDKTVITQPGYSLYGADHNGYVSGSSRISPQQSSDRVVSAIAYTTDQPAKFFVSTPSSFENYGSRSSAGAGLFHFTTRADQQKDSGNVDIGLHYAAVGTDGKPFDTDGDSLPDYLEDTNGNGAFDSGDLADFQNTDSDGDGLPDVYEYFATQTSPSVAITGGTGGSDAYKDSDGDGLTNQEEMQSGKNPLVPDVAQPVFSPVGGTYSSAQNVTITSPTTGATIRYTLDGTEPTTSSTIYSSALSITEGAMLKAKAWTNGWTVSDTETEIYDIGGNNEPPTLSVLPGTGLTFAGSDSIEILVQAEDSDGTIAKVQLFHGNYKVAETTDSVLRFTLRNVPSGSYSFTARAIDNEGAVTVSSSVSITIASSGPVVSLVGAQPFFTSSPGALVANITGVNPGNLYSVTINGTTIPPRVGEFFLFPELTEGENTFILSVTDAASHNAKATNKVYLDTTVPSIAIAKPANSSSLSTERINVTGTYTESNLKRITVNGVLAFASSGSFEARNVPLVEGSQAIIATIEDIAGNTVSVTNVVTGSATPVDPVQLAATPIAGFSSLSVTFSIPVQNVSGTAYIDFDGSGGQTTYSSSHSYFAGQYFPVITIQTTDGNRYSSLGGWNASPALRINVQEAPEQMSLITISDPVDLKIGGPDSHLFVLSRSGTDGERVKEYDSSESLVRSVTLPSGSVPTGFDVDSAGTIYVALSGHHQVARYTNVSGSYILDTSFHSTGKIGKSNQGTGTRNGEFNTPFDVAVSPDGSQIAVSDSGNHRIQVFKTSNGDFVSTFGSSGSSVGQFNTPKGLTYDGSGYLYIVDSGNNRVVIALSSSVIGTSGSSGSALGQFSGAVNLCVGPRGIYVGETGNNRVQAFHSFRDDGRSTTTLLDARLSLSTQFTTSLVQPHAIAPIADFLVEKLYIADTGNDRVIKVSLPEANTPDAVWNAMKSSLLSDDLNDAAKYFSRQSAGQYLQAFSSMGSSLISSVMNKTLTAATIEMETAQYYFEDTIGGQTITFPVEFVKENGVWKILEF